MNKKFSELVKNTGILTVANFSSKILVFLLVPLYTSILTTEEYGITDLIFSTVQLVVPIFTLNIADAVLRFTIEESKDSNGVLAISIKYTLISLIPMLVLLALTTVFSAYDTEKIHWTYILLYYISYALNQCLPTYAKGIDKVRETAISGVISTLTTVFSCIIFLVVLKKAISGFLISNILGQLAPVIYLFIKLNIIRKVRNYKNCNKRMEKRMLLYSVPLIMTNIGWWINNTSDRYIITYFYDVSLNGLLSVAYKIPSILSIVAGVFIQAWQISAMKEYEKKGSKEFYRNVFLYLNVFLYFIAFGLIIMTRPLAYIAFQKEFYSAWVFVPFLLLSMVFTANAGFFSPIITSSYNTKDVALSTVYGAGANIVLNILLLKLIGPEGVAIATAISGFIIMGYRYYVLHGLIEKKVFLRISVLWILLIIQCMIEIFAFWYLEIPLGIIAFVIFRGEIIGIVRKGFIYFKSERKNES